MLPIVIDKDSAVPLASQIVSAIRDFIAAGSLMAGEPVPSTRSLAAQLGIARGTVVAAYDQLVAESYLVSVPGGKTAVHEGAAKLGGVSATQTLGADNNSAGTAQVEAHSQGAVVADPSMGEPVRFDLTPESRRTVIATDASWREAWRRAAQFEASSEHDLIQGLRVLREAISEHLRLMRSMVVDPQDVFITTGARDGLFQILGAMEKGSVVGVEAPGYVGLRRVIARTDAVSVDMKVDDLGVKVDAFGPMDAALVTPNHLYPLGVAMPAPRRHELLSYAVEHQLLVIEDDLDSEFRHVGAILPSLWELAPQVVAHLGTFTQVLTSDARIGYVIAPKYLHTSLNELREVLGAAPSPIAQRAVASYLKSGGLRRQITKRRREILRRKELVGERLTQFSPQFSGGAMALIATPNQETAQEVQRRCRAQGVLVGDLGEYWHSHATGIVFGYADIGSSDLEDALAVVHAACVDSYRT